MINVKDYYTEEQAKLVLFCSVTNYREQMSAIKKFNRWWFPRASAVSYSRKKNAKDTNKLKLLDSLKLLDMESVDLIFDDYVNLSELDLVWPYSREYLYSKSIRMDDPEIEYRDLFGRYVFNIASIRDFVESRLVLTDK